MTTPQNSFWDRWGRPITGSVIASFVFWGITIAWPWLKQVRSPHPLFPNPSVPLAQLHGLQAALILVFLLLFFILFNNEKKHLPQRKLGQKAEARFRQFCSTWLGIWTTWLSAYIWLSIKAVFPASNAFDSRWLECATDLFSVLNAFAIWSCFLILEKENGGGDSSYRKALWLAGWIGGFCLALSILDRFYNLAHFGLACHGLYVGLGLACLVGRLGSHYMKQIRIWKLLALYLYAMIQLYYVFFNVLEQSWVWVIFIAGFILKGIVGITGIDLIQDGDLYRYLKTDTTK